MGVKTNKAEYFEKLKGLLETYKSIFIVAVDNVCFSSLPSRFVVSFRILTNYGYFLKPRSLPNRCMRFVSLSEARVLCLWARTPWSAVPSVS